MGKLANNNYSKNIMKNNGVFVHVSPVGIGFGRLVLSYRNKDYLKLLYLKDTLTCQTISSYYCILAI